AAASRTSKTAKPSTATKATKVTKPAATSKPADKQAGKPVAKSAAKATATGAGLVHPFEPYQPRRGEKYMSDKQLAHFKAILLNWKSDLMHEVDRTVTHMKDEAANFPDPADRATQEEEFSLELR